MTEQTPKDIKLKLRDKNVQLVTAWRKHFQHCTQVEASNGDIFDLKADAIISPANSFGFMNGGIDLVYSMYFGWQLEARLRHKIETVFDGLLPVGVATIVPTQDHDIPYLVCAPTMTIPGNVKDTANAYLALRAALLCIRRFNASRTDKPEQRIHSVICPGLATATGCMPPDRCAYQMVRAYLDVALEKRHKPTQLLDACEYYQAMAEWPGAN